MRYDLFSLAGLKYMLMFSVVGDQVFISKEIICGSWVNNNQGSQWLLLAKRIGAKN